MSKSSSTDRELIDSIVYLASLASNPRAVDNQLDVLRQITAQNADGVLSPTEKSRLGQLKTELATYLISSDPLRQFTQESVQRRAELAVSGERRFMAFRLPLIIIWTVVLLMAALPVMLPLSSNLSFIKPVLGISLFFTTMNMGAVVLLWIARKNFRDKLRAVYTPISTGILIVSVTLLQVPFMLAIGNETVLAWFRYVTASIPCLLAVLFIYIGVRRFCQLCGLSGRLLSKRTLALITLAATLVIGIALLPHAIALNDVPWWMQLASLAVLTCGTVVAVITVVLLIRLRRVLGPAYQSPLAWLAAVVVALGVVCIQYIVLRSIVGGDTLYENRGVAALPLLIMGFCALRVGITFKRFDGM
jgi:hypothetical protein